MIDRIGRLKKERNAVILAHNYQPPEIQDLADLCGDSLELSIRAARTDAEVIVFCGVRFMAETASILSPEKTVLLPSPDAGCPMADTVTAEALAAKKAQHPSLPVVTYVNSTAEVKAISTVCCTSANAEAVLNSLEEDELIMVPDRNLARYAAAKTGKKVHPWDGFCPYHDRLSIGEVKEARSAHPGAVFMAHPECRPEILEAADVVTSTSGMLRYAREAKAQAFIVGTEVGLLHPLQKENPQKRFYPASGKMYCADMKKIGLTELARCLEELRGEVKVPEEVRVPAYSAVKRMLDLSA
jgi:quinolinate synthase